MKYFGFDMETSGLVPHQHQILSLGAYHPDMEPLYLTIRHKELMVDPEALRVNEMDLTAGEHELAEADSELAHWIHLFRNGDKAIPVGFRVESFDLKFLKQYLPLSFGRLNQDDHGVDLNAIIHALAKTMEAEFIKLKSHLKKIVIDQIGDVQEHDALADAHIAYDVWELVTSNKRLPRIKD